MSKTHIHEVPETLAVFERTLPDGNRLEYRMQVLQQPERARACGMGAKSHADRRPVDPPPVVELRLFQGNGPEKADVTFSHNSNFLLFATLEQARPIAPGRGMSAPAPQPVLTGVPVSGMAYLDRPAPAGYFIFPDLSVRHEGRYRLRFALYEETKEEIYPLPADPLEPREFCTHRLDVKSKAFTVFSAKKFPGLAESTALSRIVAEQGCRVRIRRDVRMRRRSDRPRRESEERMDETQILRAQRGHTPDQYEIENSIRAQNPQQFQPAAHSVQRSESIDRKRSGSDASMASVHEIPAPPRFDGGYPTTVQNHGQYGPPPATGPTASHHLTFGGSHGVPPAPPQVHPPQIPPQEMYNPPRYSQHISAPSRTQQYSTPIPPYSGPKDSAIPLTGPQIQHAPMNGSQVRRGSVDDFRARRESDVGYAIPPQQQKQQHQHQHQHQHQQQYRPATPTTQQYTGQMQNSYTQQPQSQQSYPHQIYQPQTVSQVVPPTAASPSTHALPPLRLPARLPALEPRLLNGQPTTPGSTAAPALPSPGLYGSSNGTTPQPRLVSSTSQIHQAAPVPNPGQFPAYYPEQKSAYPGPVSNANYSASNITNVSQPAPESKKRAWGRVFNEAHVGGPMHDKMRPSDASYGSDPFPLASENDDSSYDIGKLRMSYRRADGVEIIRKLPGDHD